MTDPTSPAVPASTDTDPTYEAFRRWQAMGSPDPAATPAAAVAAPAPAVPEEPAQDPVEGFRDVIHALIDRARYAEETAVRKAKAAVDAFLGTK